MGRGVISRQRGTNQRLRAYMALSTAHKWVHPPLSFLAANGNSGKAAGGDTLTWATSSRVACTGCLSQCAGVCGCV